MALIDQIKILCDRLAPFGWQDFLKAATDNSLDIKKPSTATLKQELTKNLTTINRGITGLEDFSPSGNSAISPSQPSLSLVYHALMAPCFSVTITEVRSVILPHR